MPWVLAGPRSVPGGRRGAVGVRRAVGRRRGPGDVGEVAERGGAGARRRAPGAAGVRRRRRAGDPGRGVAGQRPSGAVGPRPPLVDLARREVQGKVARLGAADLAFTVDELADFAARRGVPGASLVRSEGWPALAEITASAAPDVEAAFVWQEVLAGIAPERRRALGLLAHIGPFDEELATAALGHEVDLVALTAGFPLVATGPEGSWKIHAAVEAAPGQGGGPRRHRRGPAARGAGPGRRRGDR